jgi:hypothetical protein
LAILTDLRPGDKVQRMVSQKDHNSPDYIPDQEWIRAIFRVVAGLAEKLTGEMPVVSMYSNDGQKTYMYATPIRWQKPNEAMVASEVQSDPDLESSHTLVQLRHETCANQTTSDKAVDGPANL